MTTVIDHGKRESDPEGTQLAERANGALSWAQALAITNHAELVEAGDTLRGLKTWRKRIDDHCDPGIKRWHDGHKSAIADKKTLTAPLVEAERVAKNKIADYQIEQDRIRREEQRKADEAARKAEEERRLREAEMLEREGRKEDAEAVIAQPAPPILSAPLPKAPKVEGVAMADKWEFEIIAESAVPRDLCRPDRALIRERLKATDGKPDVPGVRAWKTKSVRVGAK